MKLQTSMSVLLFIIVMLMENSLVLSLNRYLQNKLLRGLEKIRKRTDQEFDQHRYPLPTEPCFTIEQLEEYRDQFTNFIDKNGDGSASKAEVIEYLKKYNTDVTEEQADKFLERRDTNGDGKVDFIPDYIREMSSPSFTLSTAREWFDLEDSNRDGYVSRKELIEIAKKIGMPEDEAEETAEGFYMVADMDGDGKLNWEEYSKLFMD